MKREIEAYADLLGEPPRPIVAVVGGVKVSEKIQLIENILPQIDNIIIGGAIAFTFLKVQGYSIGSSFNQSGQSFTDTYSHKTNIDELAARFLAKAKTHNVKVLLPVDHICHIKCVGTDTPWITADANVPDGHMALDIGPRTIGMYRSCIETSQTAVWSGPMGVFEIPTYSTGTFVVAKAMGDETQDRGLVSIIGGGASAISARMSGHDGRVSHISSGGGASLDLLLEGKNLPGISVLDDL
jgi:phosphoglycerate kinase